MLRKNTKLSVYVVFLIIILAFAICYKLFIEDEVLAVVEGEEIRRSQMDDFLQVLKLYNPNMDEMLKDKKEKYNIEHQYLDFLIFNILINNEVNKLELEITEEAMDAFLEDTRSYFIDDVYEDEETYQQRFEELEITDAQMEELAYSEVAKQLLFEHIQQGITDEDVRSYADENPMLLIQEAGYVKASHILVETEDEAWDAYRRLTEGNEDFETLAKEISKDSSVEENGGYLGEVYADDINWDQAFLEGAFALEPGEISEPVKTFFGWHIIKAGEKKETIYYNFEEVKELVRAVKEQEAFNEYLEELWKNADPEITL
ncbi:MAG TPA: hypothetical protein GX697_02265 [Firmicutes bacterium]|nr:hypothetical protein [Bacillota bacterium]